MNNACDSASEAKAQIIPEAFAALVSNLSAAAVDQVARCGYAAAGRVLRVAAHSARVSAQAIEVAGEYARSAGLAKELTAQALCCSREITLMALESETGLARLVGNVAVNAVATPFRIATSKSA